MCYKAAAQEVKPIKLPELQKILQAQHDTLYVVNFWATWCKPCVQELPHFELINTKYQQQPVKVLLVSLDFVQDLDKRVKPFVQKRNLKSKVLLLDETDYNSWINKVEPSWSGAIPATLIFNNARKQRTFIERELSQQELEELIEPLIPSKS
ncbi:MAG: TlpA family protein disulfide reductase [Hymenobacteraceae bacterium]|nr:TlpA family protein disulfide reductase [Hymenobacteraceae bacterium]MDX5395090.1 TlpA family protein disulfide reductase [Hymenobacteraceae bacterium]MDX5511128.1 TlpA family protein disulfide reductase [Hymenobacteraceae bacterium]